MSRDGAALDQLGAEARAVDDALKATGAESADPAAPGAEAKPEQPGSGARHEQAAPGAAPESEVIPNPAPAIAAVLTAARRFLKLHGELPYSPALVAALDDAALDDLADAFGAVAVKHKLTVPGFLDRWKEEIRAGLALGSIAWGAYRAMQAEDYAARVNRARDVSPGAPGGWRDPPNPAAGVPPVEPGA